ncbi:hypothetical protein GCM10020358_08340 [Amorphoplanes nipponensis]|uniref:Uncharacterized protein n=1 Tax=Actinoplanes nipponensis TaxID=135950 RepID=A0A919JJP0_9ACTN|nr:hypothetical protein [Actinoplanes nipponensis]GIE48009.1 hypothetical protein Ani05nite_15430 [Actinoplanes nipponensis]
MRAAGLLVLGLGLGLAAGYLAGDRWGSPAVVWLGVGLIVLASVLLGVSRGGPARRPPGRRPAQPPD